MKARRAGRLGCAGVAALLWASQPAAAQDAPTSGSPVDMVGAAREAVSWHPSIKEAAARLNQQEQRIGEVRAGAYPQISGGVGLGYDSTITGDWRPRLHPGACHAWAHCASYPAGRVICFQD